MEVSSVTYMCIDDTEKGYVSVGVYPGRPMEARKGQTPKRKMSTWVVPSRGFDVNIPYRKKREKTK
jgi:hypothetical protein